MTESSLVAYAQSAAVEALNGLTDLERHLEQLARHPLAFEVRMLANRVRAINADLGEEMEKP